jgi:hypothetical protein
MRKAIATVLAISEVINRTLTVGDQSVNLAITGNTVKVTGGTAEAVALVNGVLSIVQPEPQAGPAAAPTKTTKRTPAKATGRGAGQTGQKRGPYKTKKRLAAEANGNTPEAVNDTPEIQVPVNTVAHGDNGQPLPATLAPFNVEGDDETTS